jgi:hypothetical protein
MGKWIFHGWLKPSKNHADAIFKEKRDDGLWLMREFHAKCVSLTHRDESLKFFQRLVNAVNLIARIARKI